MIRALLGLAGRVPLTAWIIAALLAWGGWNRWQAQRHEAAATAAAAIARSHAEAASHERQAREVEQKAAKAAKEQADANDRLRKRDAAAAAGARAELDRLRGDLAAAAEPGAAASGAAAAGRADGAAGARIVVGECAATALEVAEAADDAERKLIGLQSYVGQLLETLPACVAR